MTKLCYGTGNKKLKCSGESTGCSRCTKQSLTCHYSVQKQMGRPPKKRMRSEDDTGVDSTQGNEEWLGLNDSQFPALNTYGDSKASSDLPGIFPGVCFAPLQMPQAFPHLQSPDKNFDDSWDAQHLEPLPATASPWPDYSSVSKAGSSPLGWASESNDTQSLCQSFGGGAVSRCSCLSSLYLCLSHISSQSPFPISQHTLCSLFIGGKTARDVIRCQECPKTYAGGVQNVMLTGTLLNVVADGWLRVSRTDPVELGRQSTRPAFLASLTQASSDPIESWKEWLRQTVRKAVIGGPHDPAGRVYCSDCPSVLSLVKEFEDRQRKWHAERAAPMQRQDPVSEYHANSSSDSGKDECGQEDYLCLRIIGSVREVISKFGFTTDEYPNEMTA